jgi:hypothetical protein
VKYVIASVDVAKEDHLVDNNAVLSDDKFINSFLEQGFHLEKKLYDKFRTMDEDYHGKRFSSEYPEEYCNDGKKIVATYIFSR